MQFSLAKTGLNYIFFTINKLINQLYFKTLTIQKLHIKSIRGIFVL